MIMAHVVAVLITFCAVLYADHQGWRYLHGKVEVLPLRSVTLLHRLVWIGLCIVIATGARMVWEDPGYYFSSPVYLVKMGLVLLLIVNAFAIGSLSRIATIRPWRSLNQRERLPLLVSGAVSSISWLCAILLGLTLSGWW